MLLADDVCEFENEPSPRQHTARSLPSAAQDYGAILYALIVFFVFPPCMSQPGAVLGRGQVRASPRPLTPCVALRLVVCVLAQVYDHKERQHVALKMVRNEKRFHRQAQEEVRILQLLGKQDANGQHNIVHTYENFTFRNHVCITFELLNMNLYELIKKNKYQGFNLQLVRKFAHSLLQCLELCYRNRIIHCDLKPENILLRQAGRSGIKVTMNFQ